MPTIRLIPSTYSFSNTSYMSITNTNNMYHNTDNTTYATVTHSNASTTTYYIYIKGFNFSDVPSNAIVNSFTVKIKAYESSLSTSSSYAPKLCNNTTTITSSCNAITTSASVHEFTDVTDTWDTIKGYGNNFGIRVSVKRSSRTTQGYLYVYGAEILVDYTLPSKFYLKLNNTWLNATAYQKINGAWNLISSGSHPSGWAINNNIKNIGEVPQVSVYTRVTSFDPDGTYIIAYITDSGAYVVCPDNYNLPSESGSVDMHDAGPNYIETTVTNDTIIGLNFNSCHIRPISSSNKYYLQFINLGNYFLDCASDGPQIAGNTSSDKRLVTITVTDTTGNNANIYRTNSAGTTHYYLCWNNTQFLTNSSTQNVALFKLNYGMI